MTSGITDGQIAVAERRARQIETGAEISKITSAILDQDKLVAQAVNLIKDGFGFYYVGLFLLDEAAEWAVLKAGSGDEGQRQIEAGHRLPADEHSMIGWTVTRQEARIAHNVQRDEIRLANPYLPLTRAETALPLVSQGQTLGAITVQDTEPDAFTEDDITTLQMMADQLANAILNARLYQDSQRLAQEFNTLLEINREISASQNLTDLLELIIASAVKLANGEQGTVFLREGDTLIGQAAVGPFLEEMLSLRVPVGQGLSGMAAQTGQSVTELIEAPTPDTQVPGTPAVPEAIIAVPIKTAEAVIGVLLIRRLQKATPFSADEEHLLEAMALQVASAVQNARRLEQAQQAQQETNALYRMSRKLSTADSPQSAANIALQRVAAISYFQWAMVILKDDPDLTTTHSATVLSVWDKQKKRESLRGRKFTTDQLPALKTIGAEEMTIIRNMDDPLLDPISKEVMIRTLKAESMAVIAIRLGFKTLGWLLAEPDESVGDITETNVTPLLATIGQLAGTLDRIHKTNSLLEAGMRYLNMVDNIPGVVYRARLDDQFALDYASDDLTEITGYSVENFTDTGKMVIADIIHPDDDAAIHNHLIDQLQHQPTYHLQYRIIDAAGAVKYISEQGRGIFADAGQLQYVDGIMFDVTEQVQLETALAKRAAQFEAVAQVGQRASGILDEGRLLSETVDLLCLTFGFYYAGIFLLDEANEWAELKAGFGEAGEQMLAAGHRLKRDDSSMVGWVTVNSQARVALDVSEERHRFDNPYLPLTRSEIALPLVSRGKVLGALDVQSAETNAFTDDDIATLQLMANQLANVIENAAFFKTMQQSLYQANLLYNTTKVLLDATSEEALFQAFVDLLSQVDLDTVSINVYGEINGERYLEMREVWDRNAKTVHPKGVRFTADSSFLFQLVDSAESVIITNTTTDPRLASPEGQQSVTQQGIYALIALPLMVQEQRLGMVVISSKDPARNFGDEEIRFLESMVQQLTIMWQNLRLLMSVERNFRRERMIRQITGQIHGAVGVENILQTAVTELSKALDTPGGAIKLRPPANVISSPPEIFESRDK